MNDIVERLRRPFDTTVLGPEEIAAERLEAADEIERLHGIIREIASQCHNLPRGKTADRIEQIASGRQPS